MSFFLRDGNNGKSLRIPSNKFNVRLGGFKRVQKKALKCGRVA